MHRAILVVISFAWAATAQQPLRLAIAGLNHGHVSGFLTNARPRGDVKIVALYDPDTALTTRYAKPGEQTFNDLGAMLDQVKPDAVATFTATFNHAAVVEACA